MGNINLKPCRCGEIPELLFDVVQNTYYKPYIQCPACGERVEHPSHVSWGYKKSADLIVSNKWNKLHMANVAMKELGFIEEAGSIAQEVYDNIRIKNVKKEQQCV